MSDSDMEYYYEAQLLEEDSVSATSPLSRDILTVLFKEQAMAFSLFDVAGHDQVFSEEETLRGRSGSEASLYSHDGYKDSQEVEDAEDDVDIYYDDLAEDCDYYRDSDYGFVSRVYTRFSSLNSCTELSMTQKLLHPSLYRFISRRL